MATTQRMRTKDTPAHMSQCVYSSDSTGAVVGSMVGSDVGEEVVVVDVVVLGVVKIGLPTYVVVSPECAVVSPSVYG